MNKDFILWDFLKYFIVWKNYSKEIDPNALKSENFYRYSFTYGDKNKYMQSLFFSSA